MASVVSTTLLLVLTLLGASTAQVAIGPWTTGNATSFGTAALKPSGPVLAGTCGYGDTATVAFPGWNVASANPLNPVTKCGACVEMKCTAKMCTTRKPVLVVITSLCAACAPDEIHIPFSTMAAALGTPTALPLPVSYREVECDAPGDIIVRVRAFTVGPTGVAFQIAFLQVAGPPLGIAAVLGQGDGSLTFEPLTRSPATDVWVGTIAGAAPFSLILTSTTGEVLDLANIVTSLTAADFMSTTQFKGWLLAPAPAPEATLPPPPLTRGMPPPPVAAKPLLTSNFPPPGPAANAVPPPPPATTPLVVTLPPANVTAISTTIAGATAAAALTGVRAVVSITGIGVLPLTTQKEAVVQQTVAYFLTGIAHGPIQIVPASTLAAVAEDSSSSAPSSAGRRLLQGSATTPSTANVGVVVPTDGAAATATAVKAKLAAAIDAGTFARVLTGAGLSVNSATSLFVTDGSGAAPASAPTDVSAAPAPSTTAAAPAVTPSAAPDVATAPSTTAGLGSSGLGSTFDLAPATSPAPTSGGKGSSGLSTGAIVGIAVGAAAVIAILRARRSPVLLVLALLAWCRHRRPATEKASAPPPRRESPPKPKKAGPSEAAHAIMVQAGAGSRSLHRSGSGGVLIPGASPTRSSPDALRTPRTGSSARSSPGSSTRSHRHPSGGGGREASYDIYRSGQVMNIRESLELPDQPGYGLPDVPRAVPPLSMARQHSGGGFSSDLEMDAISIGSRSTTRATPYDAGSDAGSVPDSVRAERARRLQKDRRF